MNLEQKPRPPKAEPPSPDFIDFVEYLKANRGFDFSGYKLPSLMRRVQKRMQQVGAVSYADYVDYLEVHPDEFNPLFNTVLVNVTAFFRDPQAWEAVRDRILPRILEEKGPTDPIRCWSAGCASGEEAYTLAILLAQALGEHDFRQRVKIYATDADEEALAQARQGSFDAAQLEEVPEELVARYFEKVGARYVFRPDLRRSLIFGRHDLMQDAAISRLDLLVCRNTLMYFNSEMQARILARFHFALNRTGYLFLGKAETLLSHSSNFLPEDLKSRIFQRAPTANVRDRLMASAPANGPLDTSRPLRVRESAFDASPIAQIAVDRAGQLVLVNEKARRLFNLVSADLGRPLQDLEISYRPVELRGHIDTVTLTRSPVTLREIEWRAAGEARTFEILIAPLSDGDSVIGAGISFLDITLAHQLRVDLERVHQELETAYEELQSANEELETTNEELQSTVEELETTNEELQSTVEELETTNEELQSANEELETMNAELQASNEELRTVNDQVEVRSDELGRVNSHLHAILGNLRAAVVVLSPNLEIEIWSQKAQELWGLRSDEALGQPFLALDIGLPVEQIREPIRRCLEGGTRGVQETFDGVNRRGRTIRCQVTCTPMGNGSAPFGVILLMEEMTDGAAAQLPS